VATVATGFVGAAVVAGALLAQPPAITSKANTASMPMTTHKNLVCLFIYFLSPFYFLEIFFLKTGQ